MKASPVLAMLALLFLGVWLVSKSSSDLGGVALRNGARVQEVQVGWWHGALETAPDEAGGLSYRLIFDGHASSILTATDLENIFGPKIQHATATNPRGLFKVLNITSWAGIAWVCVGFFGQLCFSGRMFLQWLVSERKQASIVTSSFWWFSLVGGMMLFCYFVWRRDLVGVLGQSSGIVIYARNIQLIRLQQRAARLAAAAA
jgi:lipid-A-disaccharide synthase-like uncharacterized protein